MLDKWYGDNSFRLPVITVLISSRRNVMKQALFNVMKRCGQDENGKNFTSTEIKTRLLLFKWGFSKILYSHNLPTALRWNERWGITFYQNENQQGRVKPPRFSNIFKNFVLQISEFLFSSFILYKLEFT